MTKETQPEEAPPDAETATIAASVKPKKNCRCCFGRGEETINGETQPCVCVIRAYRRALEREARERLERAAEVKS